MTRMPRFFLIFAALAGSLSAARHASAQVTTWTLAWPSASFRASYNTDLVSIANDGVTTYNTDAAAAHWVSSAGAIYKVDSSGSISMHIDLHNNGQLTACYYTVTDMKTGNAWTGSASTSATGIVRLTPVVSYPNLNTYLETNTICSLGKMVGSDHVGIYGAHYN